MCISVCSISVGMRQKNSAENIIIYIYSMGWCTMPVLCVPTTTHRWVSVNYADVHFWHIVLYVNGYVRDSHKKKIRKKKKMRKKKKKRQRKHPICRLNIDLCLWYGKIFLSFYFYFCCYALSSSSAWRFNPIYK